ncbi:MAG: YwiC-like family protein [Propionibacteriaceae bacterium]|nr:YwiC-like family protein [Propionibacteriaceae bacterium]
MTRTTTTRTTKKKKNPGWVPNQHGAWAMLVVPFVLGTTLRLRDGEPGWFLAPLFACWMLGYFAFNAASGWLKAPTPRRPPWVKPLAVYGAASVVFGLVALLLAGWGLLTWAPAFVPLILPALWLAAQRNERATVGGALTIAAASLMVPIARHPHMPDAVGPGTGATWLVTALVFAYFFGTVLYVKTNIRERGRPEWMIASVAYHAAWVAVAAALAWFALVPWWWTAFFALTTLRAWLVPPRRWSAKHIGFLEVAMSTLLLVCFWVWPGA